MTFTTNLIMGFVIGLMLGIFYFGGLWLSVRKLPGCSHPHRLLMISALARLLPTLTVMALLLQGDPVMFTAMIPGFFVVRLIMTRRIGHKTIQPSRG